MWPATAVFPTRLPVPITASAGRENGSKRTGSKRKSAPAYGIPRASTRLAMRKRRGGSAMGSSERSSTISGASGLERLLEGLEDRDAVVLSPTQLLRASEEDRADHLVPEARERDPDDVRVVLPVDQGDGFHCLLVTSLSMRVVYFSNSRVSAENWMMRSWSWYGYFRQTSTCLPSISIRL